MECDYAVKDGRLLAATPGLMQRLLEGGSQPQARSAFAIDDSTVAVGYFNLLSVISSTSASNPAVPDAVKNKTARLDATGTAIRFQVEMNSQMRCQQSVPLKLLEQLGHLKD